MANWQLDGNAASADDFLGTTNEQPLSLRTNGAERVHVRADGNVGVGHADPRTPLHVLGRISTGLDHTSAGAISFFPPDGFAWFHIDNGPADRPIGRLRISHGVNPGSNELMSVVQNGNVGIANANPVVKLHVTGNRVRLESGAKRVDLRADGGSVDLQSETHDLYLHSNGPSGRNRVIINPFGGEGNVGVGVTNPAVKLHVVGDRVRVEGAGKKLDLRADGGAVDVQSTTHDLYLHSNGPSGRNRVIINPFGGEGNVGVGTTSPADKLHVAGNVRANDFIVTSDASLKQDVRPMRDALSKVRRLRGVEFGWKGDVDGADGVAPRRGAGVIAQEVEAVAPELVEAPPGDEAYRGVNLSGVVGMLIEALKELAAENGALRRRVDALEGGRGEPGEASPAASAG
jgi:hypothetical protein